jgi:hypothetical protein
MGGYASGKVLLKSLLVGRPSRDLEREISQIPNRVERQRVLYTICAMREEVSANCKELGDEIAALLKRNCLLFAFDERVCALREIYAISLE